MEWGEGKKKRISRKVRKGSFSQIISFSVLERPEGANLSQAEPCIRCYRKLGVLFILSFLFPNLYKFYWQGYPLPLNVAELLNANSFEDSATKNDFHLLAITHNHTFLNVL